MPRPHGPIVASVALVIVLIAITRPAASADASGNFAIKGIGSQTCEVFVAARAKRDARYVAFMSWAEGFISGINRYSDETFDLAPRHNTAMLDVIFASHCQQNAKEPMVVVVQKLAASLEAQRLRQHSPMLNVSVGDQSAQIYEEMLRRVQKQLYELGYYAGTADGVFGTNTEEALATFQITEGIEATGLPDQVTLWKLLQQP